MSPAVAFDLEPLCDLVRSDFGELPGLSLTLSQAQVLWGFDESMCRRVLQTLLDDDFLVRTNAHQFCRADQIDGPASID